MAAAPFSTAVDVLLQPAAEGVAPPIRANVLQRRAKRKVRNAARFPTVAGAFWNVALALAERPVAGTGRIGVEPIHAGRKRALSWGRRVAGLPTGVPQPSTAAPVRSRTYVAVAARRTSAGARRSRARSSAHPAACWIRGVGSLTAGPAPVRILAAAVGCPTPAGAVVLVLMRSRNAMRATASSWLACPDGPTAMVPRATAARPILNPASNTAAGAAIRVPSPMLRPGASAATAGSTHAPTATRIVTGTRVTAASGP